MEKPYFSYLTHDMDQVGHNKHSLEKEDVEKAEFPHSIVTLH